MSGDILAEIQLRASDNGGRRGPLPDDFWACLIQVHGRSHDCRVLDSRQLHPGGQGRFEIKLLNPQAALEGVAVGDSFELWEMSVVGTGTVLEIR